MILFPLALFLAIRFLVPEADELAWAFLLFAIAATFLPRRIGLRVSAAGAGLLMVCAIHIALYQNQTGLRFSLAQIFGIPFEAAESIYYYCGRFYFALLVMEFVSLMLALCAFSHWVIARIERASNPRARIWKRALLVAMGVPALWLGFRMANLKLHPLPPIKIRFEAGERSDLPVPKESLIIIQLESVNGALIFDDPQRPYGSSIALPGLHALADKGGVWIPHLWSNSFGTNLGMSSILCGTSGALSTKLIAPTDGTPCLPERFRRAGYDTSFYYSFRDADFYKIKNYVGTLGFQNFYYGASLMKADDPFLGFGYEDCQFYDRAFDHLEKRGLDHKKNIFIYMSVHMNHAPFDQHLKISHPFSSPTDSIQKYLNSAYEQDYCVAHALERIEAWRRSDLHVFFVGDHSITLNSRYGLYDRYSTSLYYLPSRERKKEFKAGPRREVSAAQDQVISTVLELFGAPSSSGSFLWSLKGDAKPANYQKCHLIADLTQDIAAVIDGDTNIVRKNGPQEFSAIRYNGMEPVFSANLRYPEDWAQFPVDKECLSRIY